MTIPAKEALHRYGIGRTKLYELLGSSALKASKLGAKTLIDVEVRRFILWGPSQFPESVPMKGGPG